MKRDYHMSDCATNNAPALPVGECNCGLEKHLTERTMTAEEYIKESIKKSWSGRGEIIYVSDALEAIRLSKIEALEEALKKVIGTAYGVEATLILHTQINQLKNGK